MSETAPLSDEQKAKIASDKHEQRVGFFQCFLRSGGTVTLAEWVKFPLTDVQALMEAGAIVAGERAAMVAEALAPLLQGAPAPADPVGDALEAAAQKALGVRP